MAEELEPKEQAERLAQRLAEPRPMRRGSVSERWIKCNKSTCACMSDENARHGPYYSLTWAVGGQTRSRILDSEQAAVAREQIEADREFRQEVEGYRRACEQWADQQLTRMQEEAGSQEAAKKGGSKRASRRKSPRKSKR